MRVDLDLVHLRDATLSPEEILMSESQERMCAIVEPEHVERFLEICEKWDVIATVIGEVTEGERLEIFWHGEQIVDVPPRSVAHEGPTYHRPFARPDWQDALQADDAGKLPRPQNGEELKDQVLKLVSSPNQASKSWITDQYDRFVQGNTVLAQPEDAGMVRIDEETNLGVAMATDGNGRYAKLDPYAGAQLALAEAYRNVAASGAKPLAISDCLNFGSPEDPAVMWQFAEATRGLADGCLQLGTPVTGGNVSLYNQTGDVAIHPTPVVAVLGVIDDVNRRTPIAFAEEGQLLYLLGDTEEEFGSSAWSEVIHQHLGGLPPAVDLDREKLLGEILISASRDGMVDAAHDPPTAVWCRRSSSPACAAARAPVWSSPRAWTPSPSSSASRRAARSSPSRAARSSASPTCAVRGVCRRPGSASSTATRSTCRASSRSPGGAADGPRGDDPGPAGLIA